MYAPESKLSAVELELSKLGQLRFQVMTVEELYELFLGAMRNMAKLRVRVTERQEADKPDGSFNYVLLNGAVLDADGNTVGNLNLVVNNEEEAKVLPLRGLFDLGFTVVKKSEE